MFAQITFVIDSQNAFEFYRNEDSLIPMDVGTKHKKENDVGNVNSILIHL